MNLSDWRQAIYSPTSNYRVGNSSFRFQTKFVIILVALTVIALLYISLPTNQARSINNNIIQDADVKGKHASSLWISQKKKEIQSMSEEKQIIETKYPLTQPVQTEKGTKYRIGIISDLDTDSKTSSGKQWISYFRTGNVFIDFDKSEPKLSKAILEWDSGEPHVIKSGMNLNGRGMELSELVVFNGKLLSCDDRTGIIYHIMNYDSSSENKQISAVPWVILADGNGSISKGFKCEWGCVKEDSLWVGGLGKEWTLPTGEVVNYDPQYVKKISAKGEVVHINWRQKYNKLANSLQIHFPGYLIHESAGWSKHLQKWVFLPRRSSFEQYNEKTDERKGTNIMLLSDEHFVDIQVIHVGEVNPTHGFSSFKFIPNTNDQLILALKSEEVEGKTASYLLIFDIEGNIILPEVKVGDHKYEGVEFI